MKVASGHIHSTWVSQGKSPARLLRKKTTSCWQTCVLSFLEFDRRKHIKNSELQSRNELTPRRVLDPTL